jgi:pimeloyl-ACP methyl ester carboxylesterase
MMADRMEAVVDDLLSRFRGFEDLRGGLSEEYLDAPVGANGLAILTLPLSAASTAGFVICRSPGPEQGPLQRLEALIARELGRNGFASVRIRRGFGDEGTASELDLDACVAEAVDAVALLEHTNIERIGVVGCLFGAAAALIAAVRLELPLAALLCPVSSGSRYLDQLYRRHLVAGLMTPAERAARREPLEQQLARSAVAIRGVRLTREKFDALAAVELAPLAAHYGGAALVAGVTRTGEPADAVRDLERSFGQTARPATVRVLRDPLPVPFGELHLRKARGRVTQDVRLDLDRELARLTVEWAIDQTGHTR